MKSKLMKVPLRKEPVLHVHRYIVLIWSEGKKAWNAKYHYCVNREEVRAICKKAPKGAFIEVHRAAHNFIQAYEVA